MRVWKYPFMVADVVELEMPLGAQVLYIDVQGDVPSIWALVAPDAVPERRLFRVYGTGHMVDANHWQHIGSFQQLGGALVWHVFEPKAVVS